MIGSIIFIIFVSLFMYFTYKYQPDIDTSQDPWLLWYNSKTKSGDITRDYIELF